MTLQLRSISRAIALMMLVSMMSTGYAQNCRELKATYSAFESRCTATGSLKVTASGGSGTYNYKVAGPTTVDFTSSSTITGLQPGSYTLTVKDVTTNCTVTVSNVVIPGTYVEPRFGLTATDVTCMNGNDGVVKVTGLTNGRAPYSYKIVAPSTSGIGTTNSTGVFPGLVPGSYSVQMIDSCGGIQTRNISIQNYTWSITNSSVSLVSCQSYNGKIELTDSKGNTNASGSSFSGFTYGVVRSPGDTSWYTTASFTFNLGNARTIALVAKDRCGQVQKVGWSNTNVPTVSTNPSYMNFTCTAFDVQLTGNLTNPQYCLLTTSGATVPGQACNSTGKFTNVPYGTYQIKVTNTCYDTVFYRTISQTKSTPAVTATAKISNYSCTTFSATVQGQSGMLGTINYCITDMNGNPVPGQACGTSSTFNNLPYGQYRITVKDPCMASPLVVTVNGAKRVRSVGNFTADSFTCNTFRASLPGATNTTNPVKYCLYKDGVQVTCNNTGIFSLLPYGPNYCIRMTDGCGDTTIERCQTVTRPAPSAGSLAISNQGCNGYTITVTNPKNIFDGQYCLTDQNGNNIQCNTTGVFNNVPYGTVCMTQKDGCTGTIFKNCFSQARPTPSIGPVSITNQTCAGFTATITNQKNLYSPSFCLYNAAGQQVGQCNATGVFNITGYGSYTIKTTETCTGMTWNTPFTVTKPVASVDATVGISAQTCTSFTATLTGIANLTGASFALKSTSGTTVATSTTGVFTNISYGSYCIEIKSSCLDTLITRCFTAEPIAIDATATATPSCTMSTTDLAIKVTAGTSPYVVKIYDTLNNLITSSNFSGSTTSLSALPSLVTAGRYKVVISGACGKPDTIMVAATASYITHVYTITPQCPSSATANGSGTLVVAASSNLSGVNMSITKKDGAAVTIGYSFRSGNNFTFSNLDAATYVITYTFTACSAPINDTVVMPVYSFPSLAKSSAYQCDNNSFSVGAAVTGGIGPYTYEIIASNPSTPSLVTAPQGSPIFSINNNTQYNLIRLRAIDACGNSALNDVSVLPLANTIVTATSNCINTATTLSTDALPNATYSWYKKRSATDSVLVSTAGASLTISPIKASDTGTYVLKTSVNAGCLTRLSYFHLDGVCPITLPVNAVLVGKASNGMNQLSWRVDNDYQVSIYEVQRSAGGDAPFATIGTVAAGMMRTDGAYHFDDKSPLDGGGTYRVHILSQGGHEEYSNVVLIREGSGSDISVYPNPVDKILNISIRGGVGQHYLLSLYNVVGQMVYTKAMDCTSGTIVYNRGENLPSGVYILKVMNTTSGESSTYKIRFR